MAITGHQDGTIALWKLKVEGGGSYRLYVDQCLPDEHKAAITVLKMQSNLSHRRKTLVQQVYEPATAQDLLIGDAKGNVSRWSTFKLSSFSDPNDAWEVLKDYSTPENMQSWRRNFVFNSNTGKS